MCWPFSLPRSCRASCMSWRRPRGAPSSYPRDPSLPCSSSPFLHWFFSPTTRATPSCLAVAVTHEAGAGQALASQGWASPPPPDVLHLPKAASGCFSCCSFPTPVNQGEAWSPCSSLYSNLRHSKSSFPNLGEVLQWFAPPLSSIGSFSINFPMEAYLH
jgi:hypothetical protein